ncbi:MAG: methionine repressor-like protein [Trueperaceae bacterium]|nr:MAG: methionine repressor-like protein [Trueperaceae bacterium]
MNTRWTIKISQETDRQLRTYLAQKGLKKGDLSRFVEEAVQERLYQLAVEEAQARGSEVPEDDLDALITEAVRWARKSA